MVIRSVDVNEHQPAERIRALANDQTALGVMAALRERGVDVPGQVAVTGFDDLPMARHLRTSLTTVRRESCGCAPGETGRTER